MANSKAPPRPRSTKAPPPTRRETIEVDLAWLEQEKEKENAKRKKPPRLPGAARTIPPMPVPASKRKPIPREDPDE